MTVLNIETRSSVVVRKDVATVYVCDGCGKRWEIGTFDGSSVNRLHPPRAWWRLAPADASTLSETDRETRHACSVACLTTIVSALEDRR